MPLSGLQGDQPAPVPFQLVPFPGDPSPVGLTITGSAQRNEGGLWLRYRLEGGLQQLRIPGPSTSAQRRDGLWESTCLEGFLARPGEAGYWEVNLSPAGHWNIYRLEGYRQGLNPEAAWEAPRLERHDLADGVEFVARVALPSSLAQGAPLELGITAVIEAGQGALSYWALRHPGAQPDFHLREGFAIRL